MKNNNKQKSLIIISILLFVASACTFSRLKNTYGLPIKQLSNIVRSDESSLIKIEKIDKYFTAQKYDFYALEYVEHGFVNVYTLAVSRLSETFYFLNYPKWFSFNNFNGMIISEKYKISDAGQVKKYLKFLLKVFTPKAIMVEEIDDAIKKGILPNERGVANLKERYTTTISFDNDNISADVYSINAEFYTITKDIVMYNWKLRMKNTGEITACIVTMMSLTPRYDVKERIIIFDIVLEKESSKQ